MSVPMLALALVACADGPAIVPAPTDVETDAPEPTDVPTDGPTDAPPTGTPTVAFGLDERPLNLTCIAPEPPFSVGTLAFERRFGGLEFERPVWMAPVPGQDAWLIAEQYNGRFLRFLDDNETLDATVALDIEALIEDGNNEGGLLGAAFHPDFASNGYLFVSFTKPITAGHSGDHVSEIARFTSSDGGLTFDPASRKTIFELDHPAFNHNGGHVLFGPDGYLYFGMGDGGSGGDPWNNAENPFSLLGKLLRFDVDVGDPYGIPLDNPYVDGVNGAPEVFALGLRNPWRFEFDPVSGDLWVGDVGQNDWEEIDLVELGGNYGWNTVEGFDCYGGGGCDKSGLIPPVAVYENSPGASVTGGVVYRGEAIPELQGVYLYIDYSFKDLWALLYDPATGLPAPTQVATNTQRSVSHFATGHDGRVFVLDHSGSKATGIFELVRDDVDPGPDPFPALLSETGCFDAADPTVPDAGLIPYELNQPFWSDGLDKKRWMALPSGTTIVEESDGDWVFPIGTVLVKEISHEGTRIETRLFMRHPDGNWGGYSYAWDDAQTDATLLAAGLTVELPDQTWNVPSRAECLTCHTTVAGGSLGLETAQLERVATYPGGKADQLATLEHIGLFATPLMGSGDPVEELDSTADLTTRARDYLHVNCAGCHVDGGPTRAELDLHRDTSLADSGLCLEPALGDLGVPGAMIVTPGDPSMSVLFDRMGRRDAWGMAPLGTTVVDADGLALMDAWISSMATCP